MKRCLAGVLGGLLALPAWANELSVAVASNFTATFNQIVATYQAETGVKVVPSYASSGKLYAQIQNGAPFQLLLSADVETPQQLEKDGLALPGTRVTYAIGSLVLWSPQPGVVDAKGEVLRKSATSKLAIANPKTAPYGLAAQQALTKLGLWESLSPRLVTGENIAQAYQYASSGNAAMGFVALSQVLDQPGSQWPVPQSLYDPIEQQMVILKRGQGNAELRRFYDYLRSAKVQQLIATKGYRSAGAK